MKTSNYSFIAVGKTQESKETGEGSFKRYVGIGSSRVLAVNPSKQKLDELRGFESQNEPEYVKDGENGKEAHINFVVRTDPDSCNGIEMTNIAMFVLRQAPAYNRDESKVEVIDKYGNHTWVDTELAKAGGKLPENYAIDQSSYRMACDGECNLVDFLKKYLNVPASLDYINGTWVLAENAADGEFRLEHVKDYFKGNFKELDEALAYQPNNKIKLLYGVRTTEDGKQYQTVCTRGNMILRNNAGAKALAKLEKDLANAKQNGSFPTTEYKVQELQEYTVEPTNLSSAPAEEKSNDAMPWD